MGFSLREYVHMTIQKFLGQIANAIFGSAHTDVSESHEPQFVALKGRQEEDFRVTFSAKA